MFDLEFVLRLVVFIVCGLNTFWSVKGAVWLAKGDYLPPSFYLAFVFFSNLALTIFQVKWYIDVRPVFNDPQPVWTFLLLSLTTVAGVISMVGHYAGTTLKAQQFYSLYGALPEALAIAELAKYDPAAARGIARDCWERIARSVHTEIDQIYGNENEPG